MIVGNMLISSTIPILMCVCALHSDKTKVELDFYNDGMKIGTGSYEEIFDRKAGQKTSIFKIIGTGKGGGKLVITQTKVIDRSAYPLSEKEVTEEIGGRSPSRTVSEVTYDDTGTAILRLITSKGRTVRTFNPPRGYSRADVSDLWFSWIPNVTPGTTVQSTVFDIEKPSWQRIETKYVGKTWITVSGHSIECHEVQDIRDGNARKLYLDDHGMPVLMINGPFRTEKHF